MKYFDKDRLIEFLVLALKRSLWTFAEVVLIMVPMGVAVSAVDWKNIFEIALGTAILSICKSIVAGMPEFASDGELMITDSECNVKLNIDQEAVNSKKSIRLKVVPDTKSE